MTPPDASRSWDSSAGSTTWMSLGMSLKTVGADFVTIARGPTTGTSMPAPTTPMSAETLTKVSRSPNNCMGLTARGFECDMLQGYVPRGCGGGEGDGSPFFGPAPSARPM